VTQLAVVKILRERRSSYVTCCDFQIVPSVAYFHSFNGLRIMFIIFSVIGTCSLFMNTSELTAKYHLIQACGDFFSSSCLYDRATVRSSAPTESQGQRFLSVVTDDVKQLPLLNHYGNPNPITILAWKPFSPAQGLLSVYCHHC